MNRSKFFVPLGVFGLVMILGALGLGLQDRGTLPSALIDEPFPEFAAPELARPDRIVQSRDIVGKPALVNVWATWCPTCKAEHDQLMKIAEQSDVVLIGLNYKDERDKALRWLADFGDPYDLVLMDLDGAIGVDLGVYGAPETFLLDAQGRIVYKRVGNINEAVWRDDIAPQLRALGVRIQAVET